MKKTPPTFAGLHLQFVTFSVHASSQKNTSQNDSSQRVLKNIPI